MDEKSTHGAQCGVQFEWVDRRWLIGRSGVVSSFSRKAKACLASNDWNDPQPHCCLLCQDLRRRLHSLAMVYSDWPGHHDVGLHGWHACQWAAFSVSCQSALTARYLKNISP